MNANVALSLLTRPICSWTVEWGQKRKFEVFVLLR